MKRKLINVSLGHQAADLYIKGGNLINVYSGEIHPANIAISENMIAYVGMEENMIGPDTEVILANDFFLAPGYIEPHAHPWAAYNPHSLMEAVLPSGTTVNVADNLLLFKRLGKDGFKHLGKELHKWPLKFYWSVRAFSQSPFQGEEEYFDPNIIEDLLDQNEILAIAEITRWPHLLDNTGQVWEKIDSALNRRKKIEGHTAGASQQKLNALITSGISCCHEAITAEQAQEQLRLGLWVMLRHSSLRPDLPELIKILTEKQLDASRVMLTSDGSTPAFASKEGLIPEMLKFLVEEGVDPMTALKMTTINPATFYGIDHLHGGIGPGRRADILFLTKPDNFYPAKVIANGKLVAEEGNLTTALPAVDWKAHSLHENFADGINIKKPDLYTISSPQKKEEVFPVIKMLNAVITKKIEMTVPVKSGVLDPSAIPGLLTICVIDKNGKWISKGLVSGFASDIEGFAASFTTSTDLVVIGKNPSAMAKAAQQVIDWNGGLALVENDQFISTCPLPIGGMMSDLPFSEVLPMVKDVEEKLNTRGYPFNDLLYTLLFFTCDFLPDLRLTSKGLISVKANTVQKNSSPL